MFDLPAVCPKNIPKYLEGCAPLPRVIAQASQKLIELKIWCVIFVGQKYCDAYLRRDLRRASLPKSKSANTKSHYAPQIGETRRLWRKCWARRNSNPKQYLARRKKNRKICDFRCAAPFFPAPQSRVGCRSAILVYRRRKFAMPAAKLLRRERRNVCGANVGRAAKTRKKNPKKYLARRKKSRKICDFRCAAPFFPLRSAALVPAAQF